ncbi:MAG: hypothetical protein ACJ8M4_11975 [Chthoniobacterales bacterium]
MKIIPKFYHGVLDYLSGVLLLLAPNLFGFADMSGAVVWIPRIAGLVILLQALMTDYELGVMKVIPIRMHLMADYLIGAFLFVCPFVFGISSRSMTATVILLLIGATGLAAASMTEPRGRPRELA